ncbi:MAG TPA: diacylglycerol kinase family protein [candidate division Zixibacteria bacterium]|nr:diacylglycerol kinase family protein [candidate division Zixibacteria bacterium]
MADRTPYLVINPQANEGNTGKNLDRILALSKEVLGEFEYGLTTGIGNGIDLAKKAKENGFSTILAVGGDGTLNEVVNAVINSNIKVGMLPTGGSCDAFQTQGIPKSLEKSLEIVSSGYTKKLPAGLAKGDTERYFIDMVNGAFTGYVNSRERDWGKSWLKGDLRYTLLAFESAMKYKPVRTTIKVDDFVRNLDLSFFALGLSNIIAGYNVLPENHPEKGDLGVVTLRDQKGLKLISSMVRLMFSSITKNKKAEILYGKNISIESEAGMTWVTEGEIFSTEAKKLEFSFIPDAINMIISKDWKYESSDAEKKKALKALNK